MTNAILNKKLNDLKDIGFFDNLIIERGIEKEFFRIDTEGNISEKSHPNSLGSALTNKFITTDFADAQLELVTPIFEDLDELYDFLYSLHVFSAKNLKEILSYLEKGEISSKIAKELFDHVWKSDKSPSTLINELGLKQVTDEDLIEKLVEKIIADNPAQVEKAKLNPKILGWFVGQVMKESKGKANPKLTNQLVAKKLK